MSVTSVPEKVRLLLWGKAAGRCEYEGCNAPLWRDSLTKAEFNTAYIAHIIADSPDGPRGDSVLSHQLKADLSNLMLLCDEHHRLIDKHDVAGHPVGRLQRMKAEHEARVELLTDIGPDKQSHVLMYGANIGAHSSHLSLKKVADAMIPDYYPAESRAIELGLFNSSITDRDAEYWHIETTHLRRMVAQQVRPRLAQGTIKHLSLFGLAPQPLLMLLGYLLSDLPAAETYQLQREPPDWKWYQRCEFNGYTVIEPYDFSGAPALVLALSATIIDSRIHAVLGEEVSIWKLTIDVPNNDFLKSKMQASAFRRVMRQLLDRMKAKHGQNATIHVFPAVPVALAIELGRVVMPKADLSMRLYDENRATGGFRFALELSPSMLLIPQ